MTNQVTASNREFVGFPKIPRLNRGIVVTEKLDGTNACIVISEDGEIFAQSRNRIITPDADNFGFATWVHDNASELIETLGAGRHFGEWWGSGIQRGYGLLNGEKRFSLFNTGRWTGVEGNEYECEEAPLCYVVPVILRTNDFDSVAINSALEDLRQNGSHASHMFGNPEGVIVYHAASQKIFKVTCENDGKPKGSTE